MVTLPSGFNVTGSRLCFLICYGLVCSLLSLSTVFHRCPTGVGAASHEGALRSLLTLLAYVRNRAR